VRTTVAATAWPAGTRSSAMLVPPNSVCAAPTVVCDVPRSPAVLVTTVASPVSITSDTLATPATSTTSHGIFMPRSTCMMSPGTSCDESTTCGLPSRTTVTGQRYSESRRMSRRLRRTSRKLTSAVPTAVTKMNTE
jgi:hypothetical protein